MADRERRRGRGGASKERHPSAARRKHFSGFLELIEQTELIRKGLRASRPPPGQICTVVRKERGKAGAEQAFFGMPVKAALVKLAALVGVEDRGACRIWRAAVRAAAEALKAPGEFISTQAAGLLMKVESEIGPARTMIRGELAAIAYQLRNPPPVIPQPPPVDLTEAPQGRARTLAQWPPDDRPGDPIFVGGGR